jgi:hypothetical protein
MAAGPIVVAFLSSGRCGTRWLASGFRELHREIDVEHEPIGALYRPRAYFRRYSDLEALLEVPEVEAHIRRIERATRPYVETGWPQFPALPLLAALLGGRLRVVHLTRHPVPSALAHVARGAYAGSTRIDAYTRHATLGPDDPRVFQPSYGVCWDRLTPYEKCLFWWTEVHLFGLELPGRIRSVPILRVQAEDLLAGDREALERLLAFMELPWHEGWLEHSRRVVDRWQQHDGRVDPLEVHRHPTTVELATELGYDLGTLNVGALEGHYRGEPLPALEFGDRFAEW